MPYRRKKTRRRRRKRSGPANAVTVPRNRFINPDVYRCKLGYMSNEILPSSAAFQKVLEINANSLYDPDASVGGYQCPGFDTLAQLYYKYRVKACKVVATFVPTGTGLGSRQFLCLRATHDSTTNPADITDCFGQSYTNIRLGTNESGTTVMKLYVNLSKFLGKDMSNAADDAALVTASPTQSVFIEGFAQSVDGVTNATGKWYYKVVYYCEFFKRKTPLDA